MSDNLQERAVELDPDASAEDKARELIPELRKQAEESERKEGDVGNSEADAPSSASPGVAEHEQDMQRRGFEPEGPPS